MVVDKGLLRRSFAVLIAASMFAGLFVVSDGAKALPADAWIMGSVTDGSDPVPNSYVKVMMFTAGGADINYTFTDEFGDYEVGVPGGFDYVVFVANGSYYMSMQPVTIMPGETLWVNFTLEAVVETVNVTLKGYVKDGGGSPITEGHVLGIVNDPMGGDTPYYANVTSPNATGYFEVDVIPGVVGGGAILMDYPGFPMVENVSEDPLEGGESYWFNITVESEASIDTAMIYGYVTDASTDLPLMNAMVAVDIWNETLGEGYSNYTFTDTDGYYEMNITDGRARVIFSKGGYSMKMHEDVEVGPGDMLNYDAALYPTTCMVRGNVTDLKADVPLVFANVFMMDQDGNFSSTITNSTGYFELRCVDGDEIWIAAEVDGYSRNYTIVSLSPGEEIWHDFGLWPVSSWIEGTVTDGLTDLAVENAWVNVWSDQYEDWTETNETGYYNVSVVPGDYSVRIGAMDYRENESMVTVPDEVAVTHDVELLPWDLPDTCMMYGWVNDTGGGIDGARVTVQLADRSYYNETWTEADGYYEMFVPPLELMYSVTAWQHYPDFGTHDFTGLPDERMDFMLGEDPWGPNLTYTQDPVDNITWFNPSVIDAEIEEPNLESFSMMQFMFWKVEDTWEHFYAIDFRTTSFDPWDPSGDIPYTQDGDNYTIHVEWDASAPGGWLSDGVDSLYLLAYQQWWGPDMLYAIRGYYSNDTLTDIPCTAFFDSETGESEMFWLDWGYDAVYADDDPTATFETLVLCIKFDVDDWTIMDFAWDMGAGQMSVADITFEPDDTVPSGDYKTLFSVSDFGEQGNGRITNMTVDNDPPVADAGDDWTEVVNTTVTIDGSASSDNVGIVSYVWDFSDNGTPVQLLGDVVEYEFELPGTYTMTLTVTDGAGHESVDTVNLTVTDDAPPVADAGDDMTVDEDTLVAFDAVGSSDDVGIDNYTWTIVELSVEMYGPTPEYTFDTPDVYTIELVVTDTIGQESSVDTMLLTVLDVTDPVASAGLDVSVPSGSTVTLNGGLSTDNVAIVSYTWTFTDDGSQSLDGEEADYTFDNVGVFVITLTVEDAAGNSDTDQVTVTVYDATDPVADAGPDQIVAAGTEVTLDGSNSTDNDEIVSWVWTFEDDGDDQTLEGETVDYTFENVGTYVVTLTVEDAAGNSDEDTVTIRVSSPPVADAGSPVTVSVGATVTFDGSGSSDDVGVENYTWTFTYGGETQTLYGVAPSFTFDIAGVYTVTLTVEDASGLTDTDTVQVTVEEDEDDGTAEDKSFLEEYWWLLAVIGVIVVVAAVAAAMMKSKKGSGGAPKQPAREAPPEEDLPPPPDDIEL